MSAKVLDKTSDEFGTPDELFALLHLEFQFTIDAAASSENAKLDDYWTKEDNALLQPWTGHRVFCNPPYSRGHVKDFFMKAHHETRVDGGCILAVLLIPTYTEREWFHKYRREFEARFIEGRVKFIGGASSARGNHMLVIFRSKNLAWWSS